MRRDLSPIVDDLLTVRHDVTRLANALDNGIVIDDFVRELDAACVILNRARTKLDRYATSLNQQPLF